MDQPVEGTPVELAGELTVTCGETVILPVGEKFFLIRATPPEEPPTPASPTKHQEPPPTKPPAASTGVVTTDTTPFSEILTEIRLRQDLGAVAPIIWGPAGQAMLHTEDNKINDKPVFAVDLFKVGALIGDHHLLDSDETCLMTSPGKFALRVPGVGMDGTRLTSLPDVVVTDILRTD